MSSAEARERTCLFLGLALAINVLDSWLVRSLPAGGKLPLLRAAASIDVVLIVCILYILLIVRPGLRARLSVLPVALAGILHATYFYPDWAAPRLAAMVAFEIGVAGFVFFRLRRGIRHARAMGTDPRDSIYAATASVMPLTFVSNVLADEFSLFYYAVFSWWAKPQVPNGSRAFSIHNRENDSDESTPGLNLLLQIS